MPSAYPSTHARLGATALALAGVLFALYPALRPFSDEVTLAGAAAFGSTNWLIAHMFAMVAFTLLPLGFYALYRALEETTVVRLSFWAFVMSQIGVGLTLPFYGGEAYGLHAVGQAANAQQDAALLSLAAVVRGGPGLYMFLVGLLLLGTAAVLVAVAVWRGGRYGRWSGIPFALGMALYIPQFFGAQPLRVAHGVLVAAGCLWLAADLWPRRTERTAHRMRSSDDRATQNL